MQVQLWIHTYSDVRLGPFQVNLTRCGQLIKLNMLSARARDIGVCSVELQKQVLPECAQSSECKACPLTNPGALGGIRPGSCA